MRDLSRRDGTTDWSVVEENRHREDETVDSSKEGPDRIAARSQGRSSRVTMHQVADEAGVSVSTVSKVINRRPGGP